MSNVEPNATLKLVHVKLLLPYDIVQYPPKSRNKALKFRIFIGFIDIYYIRLKLLFEGIEHHHESTLLIVKMYHLQNHLLQPMLFSNLSKNATKTKIHKVNPFDIDLYTSCNGIKCTTSSSCTSTNDKYIVFFTAL